MCDIEPENPVQLTEDKNIPTDDIEIVMKYSGILEDKSPLNPFRNAELKQATIVANLPKDTKPKVLVFQRNSKRIIEGVENVILQLKSELNKNSVEDIEKHSENLEWEVELYQHDNERSPCEVVSKINSATALFTAHGFQSILLMYQPKHSVLAEMHPFLMYIPHFYGELQLAYRQRFGFVRAFVSEESAPTGWLLKLLVYFGFQTKDSCVSYKFCRHLSKAQNIIPSDAFIQRFAKFMNTHFKSS